LFSAVVFSPIKEIPCEVAEAPLGACHRPVSGRHEAVGFYYSLIRKTKRRAGNEDLEVRLKPPSVQPGFWAGTTTPGDHPVESTVGADGRHISKGAQVKTYYDCRSAFFRCYGTVKWNISSSIPMYEDNSFRFSGTFDLMSNLTWEGHFTSPSTATGAYTGSVWTTWCGSCGVSGTWEASWQGSSGSMSTSTSAPTLSKWLPPEPTGGIPMGARKRLALSNVL
jgi:hypothetical protein